MDVALGAARAAAPARAGPPLSPDEQWPETEGYHEFAELHANSLAAYAGLRDLRDTEKFLKKHLSLMEGSGHVGRWFLLRHTAAAAARAPDDELRLEARQFFLLDTACDAANAHFVRLHGPGAHGTTESIRASAKEGIKMLFQLVLKGPVDPLGVRPRLEQNVARWAERVAVRAEEQRAREVAEAVKKARRRREQQEAERAVEAERQVAAAARGRSHCRTVSMLTGLVLLAAISYGHHQANF